MIGGMFGATVQFQPCIIHISITRYSHSFFTRFLPTRFLVSIHEEGSGFTWQQKIKLAKSDHDDLLNLCDVMKPKRVDYHLPPDRVQTIREQANELGSRLYELFIGKNGKAVLDWIGQPTAVLFDVDESIQHLPWELICRPGELPLPQLYPFGRLVTSGTIPATPRKPLLENGTLRILAIINPATPGDPYSILANTELEVNVLKALASKHGENPLLPQIELTIIEGYAATWAAVKDALQVGNFDLVHFSSHGNFAGDDHPQASSIRLADQSITANEILNLQWQAAPPYLVFAGSCESAREAKGKRLNTTKGQCNGLASAFILAGVSGYIGFYDSVLDSGASLFISKFYESLFELKNIGLAIQVTRADVAREIAATGDLVGLGAVYYGDAASGQRPDLFSKL